MSHAFASVRHTSVIVLPIQNTVGCIVCQRRITLGLTTRTSHSRSSNPEREKKGKLQLFSNRYCCTIPGTAEIRHVNGQRHLHTSQPRVMFLFLPPIMTRSIIFHARLPALLLVSLIWGNMMKAPILALRCVQSFFIWREIPSSFFSHPKRNHD